MSSVESLPCLVCGKVLYRSWSDHQQPSDGTEFRTYGHYGSTFWDSFHGEEIIINICDECLRKSTAKIERQKRFRQIKTEDGWHFGREWLDHERVSWFEEDVRLTDDSLVISTIEELDSIAKLKHVELYRDRVEIARQIIEEANRDG